MDKAQQILFHLDELYAEEAKEEKDFAGLRNQSGKIWRGVMLLTIRFDDVLFAIDEFWQVQKQQNTPECGRSGRY